MRNLSVPRELVLYQNKVSRFSSHVSAVSFQNTVPQLIFGLQSTLKDGRTVVKVLTFDAFFLYISVRNRTQTATQHNATVLPRRPLLQGDRCGLDCSPENQEQINTNPVMKDSPDGNRNQRLPDLWETRRLPVLLL